MDIPFTEGSVYSMLMVLPKSPRYIGEVVTHTAVRWLWDGLPRLIPVEEPAAAPVGTGAQTARPALALSCSEAARCHVNILLSDSGDDG